MPSRFLEEVFGAQLCARTKTDFQIEDDQFYSEMSRWFGDYPGFPARVQESGEFLQDVLQRTKEELQGKKTIKQSDAQLPFLPKVQAISRGWKIVWAAQGHGRMKADGREFELMEGCIFFVAPGISVKWQTDTGMQMFTAVA